MERPAQETVEVLLDEDVLLWLQKDGQDYHVRANQLLRERMLEESGAHVISPEVLQKMTDEEFMLCVFGIIYKELGRNGLARFLKSLRRDGGDGQASQGSFVVDDVIAHIEASKMTESTSQTDVTGKQD